MEQARIYNKISDTEFTETQLVTFLNACLSGTPNLSQVLTLHRTAQKAAGITASPIGISEYVALLLDQAQVHDAGNTNTTNPRAQRSVNSHEFLFKENDPPNDSGIYKVFNTEIHDDETPIEYLINRTKQGPRRPRVDFDTWKSLSKEDQVAWDTVSDKGKTTIMTYVAKNASKFTGILKNGDKKTRFASDVSKPRQAYSHEQTQDSTPSTELNQTPNDGATI
jgi:hypothetical protein